MKIFGKECKLFVNKMIKQMNSILRYNTESVLMCQLYSDEKKMDFIILTKPMPISFNIFNYLNEIYVDNEFLSRSIKHIPKSQIKHKFDSSSYAPMIISTQNSISLINIERNDLENKEFVFPTDYNKYGFYSESFFIIPDLFKEFVDNHIINGIDDEFNMYEEENTIYDTSGFLIKINKASERAVNLIKKYSPNKFFPMDVNKKFDEEKEIINNEIHDMIIKLNSAVCNFEIRELIFNKDVLILTDDTPEFDSFVKKLKEDGSTYIKNKLTGDKILVFDEFFKGKNKCIFLTSIRREETLTDGTKVPTIYAGIVFKNKDIITYLFYKYFEYDDKDLGSEVESGN